MEIKTSVKANGDAIRRMRKAKLWTLKRLAANAKCSERTIRSAEQSAQMQMFTIERIANALDADFADLIDSPPPPRIEPKQRTWEVSIKISTPFEEFDESKDLTKFLEVLIERLGGREIIPSRVTPGSVSIGLEMGAYALQALLVAYIHGNLDDLNIITIEGPYRIPKFEEPPRRLEPPEERSRPSRVAAFLPPDSFEGDKEAWMHRLVDQGFFDTR